MEITIFEVHLPEAQFNAPFSTGRTREESEKAEPASETEPGAAGEGPSLAPIGFIALVVGVAALARYLRRSAQSELDEFEEA